MGGNQPIRAGGAKALPAFCTAFALALMLAACGGSDTDPGPGGVTVGEARALDEAAQMLDEQRLPPGAVGESDEATPAPEAAAEEAE
ncbi:hypothetical protein FHS61_001171 [Altererythrobacter atlanticus]|uniref:Uncharacterized protein n=1 Tax=Croceibacterium atlanticum TaxID=1267766 RepID=A0A0F7KU53_9SPHN|nr:hypothetical protein [Croceibacterium atlanticum]AKH43129.1 hypothetical protein WYH_02095 [Croceibacterium atlanticum]MBB5732167.1 hypothetical protein [Croceibacterium atlanticum]